MLPTRHWQEGGGVDGAIHSAGGPSIMSELKAKYKGCPTGSAVITGGGNLKAKYVIHAVGPRYSGSPKDAKFLSSALSKKFGIVHTGQYFFDRLSFHQHRSLWISRRGSFSYRFKDRYGLFE